MAKILRRNFKLKNCFVGATDIINNGNKEKYVYNDYWIAFDGRCSWSFNNDSARNVIVFGVDSISPSHTDKSNKFDNIDLKKYLLKKMWMIFQLIMMLLINLTF